MKLNFWKKDSQNADEGIVSADDGLKMLSGDQTAYLEPPADNIYSKVSRWTLYLGFFLIPLFFLPLSSSVLEINKQILLLAVSGIALVSWLLNIVSSGWLSWRKNPVDYSVAGLVLATALSAVFSVDKFKSIFGTSLSLSTSLLTIISLAVFYYLVVHVLKDNGVFARSLLGLSILIALIFGLLQILNVHVPGIDMARSRAFNTVGAINAMGLLAAIALPFLNRIKINIRYLSGLHLEKLGTIIAFAILMIINWRLLWIVAIVGMVMMIVLDSIRGEKFKLLRMLLPMTAIIFGVFLMIVNINLGNIKSNFPVEVGPSINMSYDIAKETLNEKPIFGFGPENYFLAFDRYGANKISNSTLSSARFFESFSEVMTLVVQGGIVMILALLFFFWMNIKTILKFKSHAQENTSQESLREEVGIFSSMIAAIVGMFIYPFSLTLMFVLFAIIALAISAAWSNDMRYYNIEEKTSLSLVASLAFIGGLILVLVGGYFGGMNYFADVKYAKALGLADNREETALLVQAINLNGKDDRYYRSASQTALDLLETEINNQSGATAQERTERVQNYTSSAVSLARRATEVSPMDTANWANLGEVYQDLLTLVTNADRLSEEAYLKAAELRPGDANYYNRIGLLYLSKYEALRQIAARSSGATLQQLANEAGVSLEKSAEGLRKAIEIAPNFGVAIYNLGAVYDRQNKIPEAIGELEKIIPANPSQPGLNFELGLLYYRAGRKNEALEQLRRAVLLAPDYSNARWYMALIYEENKDFENAIKEVEAIQSIEVNKNNQTLTTKLNDLRAGRVANPPVPVTDRQPIN